MDSRSQRSSARHKFLAHCCCRSLTVIAHVTKYCNDLRLSNRSVSGPTNRTDPRNPDNEVIRKLTIVESNILITSRLYVLAQTRRPHLFRVSHKLDRAAVIEVSRIIRAFTGTGFHSAQARGACNFGSCLWLLQFPVLGYAIYFVAGALVN